VRGDLDISSMKNIAVHLLGEHDFTSFSKRSDDVEHYRCTIDLCEVSEEEERKKIVRNILIRQKGSYFGKFDIQRNSVYGNRVIMRPYELS
jgi:tRNA U38,U39,U40 pseudouridine synthase TruA